MFHACRSPSRRFHRRGRLWGLRVQEGADAAAQVDSQTAAYNARYDAGDGRPARSGHAAEYPHRAAKRCRVPVEAVGGLRQRRSAGHERQRLGCADHERRANGAADPAAVGQRAAEGGAVLRGGGSGDRCWCSAGAGRKAERVDRPHKRHQSDRGHGGSDYQKGMFSGLFSGPAFRHSRYTAHPRGADNMPP